MLALLQPVVACALVADRLGGTNWRLRLNIGREKGSAMPPEWAATGARLAFTVDVSFDDEAAPTTAAERLLGPAAETKALRPLETSASFVGLQGTVTVPIASRGAWVATTTPETAGLGAMLRWYMDFPEGASRNDVELPAGRLFFTGAMWDVDALGRAEAEADQLEVKLTEQDEEAVRTAKAAGQGNPLERALATRKAVLAKEASDMLRRRLQDRSMGMPDESGVCAGPRGLALAAGGLLCVKRRGGPLGLSEVYNIVGRYELLARPAENDRDGEATAMEEARVQ